MFQDVAIAKGRVKSTIATNYFMEYNIAQNQSYSVINVTFDSIKTNKIINKRRKEVKRIWILLFFYVFYFAD
jgi:hypothetical protein